MENFLVLGLLLVLFVVVGLRSSSRPEERRPKSRTAAAKPRAPLLPKSLGEPLTPPAPDGSESFDATTAREVPAKRVIRGRAYVTDGDTITIEGTQIRLFGIDAPELNHPFGQKAKWAMVRLCKGQIVQAEILAVDDHGRTVAHCTLADGRDLSAELVKEGLAIDWPKYSGGKYRHLETPDARKKIWLADARQKGRMHVWEKFENRQTGQ